MEEQIQQDEQMYQRKLVDERLSFDVKWFDERCHLELKQLREKHDLLVEIEVETFKSTKEYLASKRPILIQQLDSEGVCLLLHVFVSLLFASSSLLNSLNVRSIYQFTVDVVVSLPC